MLLTLLHLLYIPVCLFLILVVLLQTGKRADLAGAFGGGGSQTAFGARGAATLLSKLTTVMAVLFMITALALAILTSREAGTGGSVLDDAAEEIPPASAPLVPGDASGTPAAEEAIPPAAEEGAPAESDSETDLTGSGSQP